MSVLSSLLGLAALLAEEDAPADVSAPTPPSAVSTAAAVPGRIVLRLGADGGPWLWVALSLLALGILISLCRKILIGFSRKALLESLPDSRREAFEEILGRLDEHKALLRGMDQVLRLCVIAAFSFAVIWRDGEEASALIDVASFLVFAFGLLVSLVFSLELVPSVLSRMKPELAARAVLPLIDQVHKRLEPLGSAYTSLVRVGARAVGAKEERAAADVVEEEILSAVEEGEREGVLKAGAMSMIESMIRFPDSDVAGVMTPRTAMVCIDIEESLESAVRRAIDCGHSRIPVYRENKDNVAGILYVKDLLKFWAAGGRDGTAGGVKLADTVRQAHFVPESKKISELFHEFKSQRFHIAIVLDEFGGTAGLITIEDIIEEILGEIADEFEKPARPELQEIQANLFEVDARLPIHELNERMALEIPENGGYETVGGFLFSAMGRIPPVGTSYEHGPARFEVIEADERKIDRLRVKITRPEG